MKKHKILYSIFVAAIALLVGGSLFTSYAQSATVTNPSFEEAGTPTSKALGWYDFGNGYSRVTGGKTGTYAIRLSNSNSSSQSGAYQRINLNQTTLKPVFIGGYVKGSGIQLSQGGYLGASLYAEIHLQNGTIVYWNSVANYGTFGWRWIGFNTGTLPSVNQPISHIFVVPILAQATGIAFFDDIKVQEYDPTQAAMTIMFDDGEDSIFTAAKPVMDSAGYKGSIAMISQGVNQPGHLTSNQLVEFQNNGWDIVSHSVTHSDLTTLPITRIRRELSKSKNDLQAFGLNIKHFALPFGAYNSTILAEGAKLYQSIRAYEQGSNPKGVFPLDVKVRGVLNTTSASELQQWITEAQQQKKWIVLVFHRVTATGDDAYYVTPQKFSELIQTIKNSGIQVVNYDQGIQIYSVK